jgi:hypothetical protein
LLSPFTNHRTRTSAEIDDLLLRRWISLVTVLERTRLLLIKLAVVSPETSAEKKLVLRKLFIFAHSTP